MTSARDVPARALAEKVDALLPQTQCRKCGYSGCRPYAEAIANGKADINQCPPGGDSLARDLAVLLNVPVKPLDAAFGQHQPLRVAVIDEAACIGCTLCIQACPVDAIVGAAKLMHTVIAAHCTGCELCIPPCPVDCILMVDTGGGKPTRPGADTARAAKLRYESRTARLKRERADRAARAARSGSEDLAVDQRKRATVRRAIERARARLDKRRA